MIFLKIAHSEGWSNPSHRLKAPSDALLVTGEVWERLFCWETAYVTTSPGQQGRGERHPRRGASHPDPFHQRSAAGGRPAAGELRLRDRGETGADAVSAARHPTAMQIFRVDPRRGWDRGQSSNIVLGRVKRGCSMRG
jgi:hypothetical protein